MSEMVERVTYAMCTYQVEEHVNGTFWIQDRHGKIVREGLTGANEPHDICDEMNARAAIEAIREPSIAMVQAGSHDDLDNDNLVLAWELMIDEALR